MRKTTWPQILGLSGSHTEHRMHVIPIELSTVERSSKTMGVPTSTMLNPISPVVLYSAGAARIHAVQDIQPMCLPMEELVRMSAEKARMHLRVGGGCLHSLLRSRNEESWSAGCPPKVRRAVSPLRNMQLRECRAVAALGCMATSRRHCCRERKT